MYIYEYLAFIIFLPFCVLFSASLTPDFSIECNTLNIQGNFCDMFFKGLGRGTHAL